MSQIITRRYIISSFVILDRLSNVLKKDISRLPAVETFSKSFHLRLGCVSLYVASSDSLSPVSVDTHNRKDEFVFPNLMTSSSKMFIPREV